MANMKIVYGTILPDISSEETIIVILLCAVLETLKIRTTGAQRHDIGLEKNRFKKACESIVMIRICNYDLYLMILT